MINYIQNQIAYGVNWVVIFYIVFGTVVLGIIIKWCGLSPTHIARETIKEIGQIFTSKSITRMSIDGALTFALISFTAIVLIISSVHELGDYVSLLRTGVEKEGQASLLAIFMIFWTSIMGITSLIITDRPNGDRRQ